MDCHNNKQCGRPPDFGLQRGCLWRGNHWNNCSGTSAPGIRNIFGGRSQGYEEELQAAREEAIQEMCGRAQQKGANAVVGVDVDYEILGSDNGMLMVSVSGTAVVI